ncbi:hypothetical protein CPC08DRAFT_769433 [Agrocybe pediades]|nr:hypothetical protein CPC08DRAFT_769433 [Agrocybe pediades]
MQSTPKVDSSYRATQSVLSALAHKVIFLMGLLPALHIGVGALLKEAEDDKYATFWLVHSTRLLM